MGSRYLVDLAATPTNLIIGADDDVGYFNAIKLKQGASDPAPNKPRYESVGMDDPRIVNASHGVSGTTVTGAAKPTY